MKISALPQLYRNLNRWREIIAILSKYGLADWISRVDLDFAKGLLKDRAGESLARLTRENRIRLALVELGPTFIKLGQILSTRPDLVGLDLAGELQQLQTNVQPDPPDVSRGIIESELGQSIESLFAEFEPTPMASASIGQVHRARLHSGEAVVIKVQRAGIADRIRVDLEILAALAQMAERVPEFVNYHPRATAAEFSRVLRRELDFSREGRHLEQFGAIFADSPVVRIPRVYSKFTTPRVLTMERIEGVKLADCRKINGQRFDLEEVARRGADLYLEMIFVHGVYHADPHPGNIVLLSGDVIGLLDFGMIGRLDEQLREDIEEMLLGVVEQDPEFLTSLIVRVGSPPADLDQAALGLDVADFVSHYGAQSLAEFNLSGALNEMTEMIRRYHIMLPPRLAMLIKVLVMLEGTSRLLWPNFSLVEVMAPYRRKMLRRRLSPWRRWRKMRRVYGELEHLAQILPRRFGEILRQMQSGQFDVHLDHRGLEPSVNRLVLGMLASSLFLGSSLLLSRNVPPLLGEVSVPGLAGVVLSLMLGLRLLRAINKSGHLDRRK